MEQELNYKETVIENFKKIIAECEDTITNIEAVLKTQKRIIEIARKEELDEDTDRIIIAFEETNSRYEEQIKNIKEKKEATERIIKLLEEKEDFEKITKDFVTVFVS